MKPPSRNLARFFLIVLGVVMLTSPLFLGGGETGQPVVGGPPVSEKPIPSWNLAYPNW